MVDRCARSASTRSRCLIDFGVDAEAVLASLEHLDAPAPASDAAAAAAEADRSDSPAQIAPPRRHPPAVHAVAGAACSPRTTTTLAALRPLRTLLLGGEALPPSLAARLGATRAGGDPQHVRPDRDDGLVADAAGRQARRAGADRPADRQHRALRARPRGCGRRRSACRASCSSAARASRAATCDRPELTAERFVARPVRGAAGRPPLPHRGPRRAAAPTATLEFLGRLDHQVKIRGYRIELGEIEAALGAPPRGARGGGRRARTRPGDRRLVAYVVPRRPAGGAGAARRGRPTAGLFRLPNGIAVAHLGAFQATTGLPRDVRGRRAISARRESARGACVFDVGANVGLFTLYADQRLPRRAESSPSSRSRRPSRRCAPTSRLYGPQAGCSTAALADRPGRAEFTFYPQMARGSPAATADRRATVGRRSGDRPRRAQGARHEPGSRPSAGELDELPG